MGVQHENQPEDPRDHQHQATHQDPENPLVPLATAGLLYAAFNGHASDARVLFGSIVGTAGL